MQKYRKRQPRTEIVEPIFGMGFDMDKDVEKAAFVGVGGRLEEWYREDFDRQYERVEEKGEASIEHRFYCTQCYKDCDGLTEACHIAGRVGVVCPDCLSLHRDREAEVAAALHKHRAKCEWERTHKGEWTKGPKDWWYLCADCDQPIPPSSDWLWKHGMCGSRICEACGKKRQAQGKHGIVYICQACGAKLYDGLKDVVMHKGRILCQSCYLRYCRVKRAEEEAKKPTPPTLFDLKPGDVFRLVSHDFCQAKHQLLSAKEFWCSRDRKSITITHSEREVVLIAHHDLIPKQLLWIAASDEERKALDDSIREKWLPIMRGEKKGRGEHDCPLCQLRKPNTPCSPTCILMRGGFCGCGSQGYQSWAEDVKNDETYQQARLFALNLAAYLPDIDPTRIEVEATPVEWPGGK